MARIEVAQETYAGIDIARVTVLHPNGGTSEVVVSVHADGSLNVDVDPSRFNAATVDVNEITVSELDGDPLPVTN